MSDPTFSDGKFSRYFLGMILTMIVLTAVLMVLAKVNATEVNDTLKAEAQQEKLEAMVQAETTAKAAAPAVEVSGDKVYAGACAACHNSGAAGAPITGNIDSWAARIAKGTDALYNSAINGIGIMPARGGQSLSDEQVKAAVDYMVGKSK